MMLHRTRIKEKYINNIPKVQIQNQNLSSVNNTKFLGVIIDKKLNWVDHITFIKNKISKSIGIINKIRKLLDKNTLRNLYFTFIYPYLIYCIEIWGNTHNTYLLPLIKLQKKCVRIITFSHYLEHTEPLFKQLYILNFNALVTQRISLIMFKIHTASVPLPISNLFTIYTTTIIREKIIYIHKSEEMKTVINYSVSMVLIFGTTFPKKIKLMCHMLVIKLCPKNI